MKETIKGFDELGKALIDQKKEEAKKIFDESLKGKFDRVPPGNFKSNLPAVESISIIPVRPVGEQGRFSINATVNYINENQKERSVTWSVFEEGVVSGKVPPDLKVSREDLALEILKTIERVDVDFWRKTDLDILPAKDVGEPRGPVETPDIEVEKPLTEPERLEFLEGQPKIIFGFVNEKNGFKGYRGAVFPKFILLENDAIGNAAYIVDLPEAIEVEEDASHRGSAKRVDKKTSDEILDRTWRPISEKAKSRKALREQFGATRIIHSSNTWKERLQEAIDERLKVED